MFYTVTCSWGSQPETLSCRGLQKLDFPSQQAETEEAAVRLYLKK